MPCFAIEEREGEIVRRDAEISVVPTELLRESLLLRGNDPEKAQRFDLGTEGQSCGRLAEACRLRRSGRDRFDGCQPPLDDNVEWPDVVPRRGRGIRGGFEACRTRAARCAWWARRWASRKQRPVAQRRGQRRRRVRERRRAIEIAASPLASGGGLRQFDGAVGSTGLAGDVHEQTAVHQAIGDGAGGGGIVKQRAPVFERQVGRNNRRDALITLVEDLVEQVGPSGVEGQVPELVDEPSSGGTRTSSG